MHQIGVVGLSYRHAGVDEVARFSVPRAEVAARLPGLRTGLKAAEILYVGTCNRVEVVFATEDGGPAADLRAEVFRRLTGREPQPGEAARCCAPGPARRRSSTCSCSPAGWTPRRPASRRSPPSCAIAWEDSRAAHTCGPVLDRLIGEALGMARRVRRLTARIRTPSLGDLAAERVLAHLAGAPRARRRSSASRP